MEAVTVRTVWVMIKNIAVHWLCKITNLQVHESRYPLGNNGNFRSRIVDLTLVGFSSMDDPECRDAEKIQ